MTDAELMEFCLPGEPRDVQAAFLSRMKPAERATYERMSDLCNDIDLWQAGVAPKPDYAIICGPKQIKRAGIEKPERKTVRRNPEPDQ